ncbi:hypothetical protein ASD64_07310 [Mesorhizobium sp. Root157]|nr:hypothetical protein ASD64_07310 [Mesorhizobium sp. Root157]
MNDRLALHFVRRLRREAERRAVDAAVEAGFLREEFVDSGGRVLHVFHRGEGLPATASGKQAAAMLARRRRRLVDETSHPAPSDLFVEEDQPQPSTSASQNGNSGGPVLLEGSASATEIVRAVRAAAEPPRASEVACLLLVAQAVTNAERSETQTLGILGQQQPIVAIHCGTRHFETCFLDLLGRGLILPGEVTRCNGYDIDRRRSFYFPNAPAAKRQIVSFAGKDRDRDDDHWHVAQAVQGSYPILLVSERDRKVPAKLAAAAQLKLDCGTLNAEIVKRTIRAVLGEIPTEELDDIDFGKLDLADLSIAIRPGVTPSSAAATLRILASDPDGEPPDDNETKASAKSGDSNSTSSGSGSSGRRGKDHVSGSEIVQPKDISGADSGRFIERIETFSGCDEARDWGLSLKEDLPLWQAGGLHWEEMSTKLLLSGPPGTGKTMFARSLCNSLQIPMFSTSMATWLEPAYLGDVVKRIKRAFAEAVTHHPAILFIDEIDGIGRRTDFTRDYADYWNALVNCLLELLDGAARTTGVIVVGATNYPAIIDPALLRSGRLSPHLKISPPDVAARMGILRHHLGDDLDSIIATAPKPTALQSEDDLRSFLHTLPDAVLRDLAANGIEDIAWKGTP